MTPFGSCQTFIEHLRAIVGGRDRTRLNGALLQAVQDLFQASRVSLLRVVSHNGTGFVIPCGTATAELFDLQDAYLLSPRHGHPSTEHRLYQECIDTAAPVQEGMDGWQRHIFPLLRHGVPHALLELDRPVALHDQERSLIGQLIHLFIDHLALIDYAETDTLTGLLNRKTFDENLTRVLASAGNDDSMSRSALHPHRRHSRPAGGSNWLAVTDIDHFKRVNDNFGHIIGDEVLLLVAQQMRRAFRFDDQLFRFGGEEFITVLQPASQADALAVLDRFRRNIETHEFPIVGQVTVSIGFTRIDPMDTPTELVGRADQALYFAKENGRNQVSNYEDLDAAGYLGDARAGSEKPAVELF